MDERETGAPCLDQVTRRLYEPLIEKTVDTEAIAVVGVTCNIWPYHKSATIRKREGLRLGVLNWLACYQAREDEAFDHSANCPMHLREATPWKKIADCTRNFAVMTPHRNSRPHGDVALSCCIPLPCFGYSVLSAAGRAKRISKGTPPKQMAMKFNREPPPTQLLDGHGSPPM